MSEVENLYHYDELRRLGVATMIVAQLSSPVLVLGGSQSLDVLDPQRLLSLALRRRRGGGGLVLLRPGDLWVDWWIPSTDARWSHDVHVSSIVVGTWWKTALSEVIDAEVLVHDGPLEGERAWRVACFAGRGPGEVFVDDRKAVGVTQWRVREGVFLSTVLHGEATSDVVRYLRDVPEGLEAALDHHALSSWPDVDRSVLVERLQVLSAPLERRSLTLPS